VRSNHPNSDAIAVDALLPLAMPQVHSVRFAELHVVRGPTLLDFGSARGAWSHSVKFADLLVVRGPTVLNEPFLGDWLLLRLVGPDTCTHGTCAHDRLAHDPTGTPLLLVQDGA
jgi:hypothetical protein